MPENKIPLVVVVGTRPEAIKLVPLILALRKSESFRPVVVSTGQHHSMVAEILELAEIHADADLWIGDYRSRLNARVGEALERFEDFCAGTFGDHRGEIATADEVEAGEYPGAVLVHGDTSSAFAAALASFHLRIPVCHVEAGLRTGSNLSPFPEELNRELISKIASLHLAPTRFNQENLVRENIPLNRVYVTGNTAVDAMEWAAGLEVPFASPDVQRVYDSDSRVVVVTAHRRENWGGGLGRIAQGVAAVADSHPDVRFVVSVHPNPRVHEELCPPLEGRDNVLLAEPLGYAGFARLLGRCAFAITDSGGIQEEAPALGKPVLVARESTERVEGLRAGTLRLVGTDPALIADEAARLLDDEAAYTAMASRPNPYGDGRASERIVAAFEYVLNGGDAPAPFGGGFSRTAVQSAAGYRRAVTPDTPDHAAGERGAADSHEPEHEWPVQ